MVDQSFFGVGDAKLSFKGDGFGFGYNVGLLLFPDKKLSFGFSYRSGTRVKQKGDLALEGIAPALQPVFGGNPFRTKAHTVVNFPEIFGWGVAYRPTPKLTLALDVEWLRWSSFKRLALVLDKKVPAAGFSDIVTDLDWSDAMFIKVGVDYKARENFSLRAGYAYQETPIPEHTLSPGNPDSDQHCFSAGLGYTRGKWVFDGFYTIGFFPDRTVDNAILSGKYKNLIHYFGLSVNYRF
jgi:long-chain fatty acid transport protein